VDEWAALQWTNWCLCCGFVPAGDTFDEAPVSQLNSDPLAPCGGIRGAMICCFGKGEDDYHILK